MTQNEFKVISQQIVTQVGKEAKKLEGDKQRLAAALKKSEEICAKVSSHPCNSILLYSRKVLRGSIFMNRRSFSIKYFCGSNFHENCKNWTP